MRVERTEDKDVDKLLGYCKLMELDWDYRGKEKKNLMCLQRDIMTRKKVNSSTEFQKNSEILRCHLS